MQKLKPNYLPINLLWLIVAEHTFLGMEIITFIAAPCRHDVNLRWKLVDKGLNSCQSKLPTRRKPGILCARVGHGSRVLRFCSINKFLKNHNHKDGSGSSNALGGLKNVDSKVLSGNYNSYVIGGEEDVESIPESGESATRVVIPGLPDESNGECSASISSCFWEWKPKFNVHYEKAGCKNMKSPPVLFLPGFGVGSFHFEKQLKDLGREYRVWAIDFLGQGMSLPVENPTPLSKEGNPLDEEDFIWGFGDEAEPWASELVYSMDLWRDQVCYFIKEVVNIFTCFPYFQSPMAIDG